MINLDKLIFYLKKTLVNKCLLIFENNKMIETTESNLKNNFPWININGVIYTINHFKKYYDIINTYCFSYKKFNELNINSNINIDIFSIYFIFSCFLNNVIINSNTNKLLLKNIGKDNLIIYNIFSGYKEISIHYDTQSIINIYRNQYRVYDNNLLDLYCTPNLIIDKHNIYELYSKKFLVETLIDLPIYILSKFIKTCFFLIKQYPILNTNYKKVISKKIIKSNKIKNLIKLIWTTSWKEINYKNIKKNFMIIILCNTQNNKFRTFFYYNSYYSNFSPFSKQILDLYNQIENNKIFYLPNKLNIKKFNNHFYITNLVVLFLIITSLSLKNLIYHNLDKLTYLSTNLICSNIYDFLDLFIEKYFYQRIELPLIILWDPLPRFYYFNNNNRNIDNLSYSLLKYITLVKKFNFIHQNIINIYLYEENNEWSNNLKIFNTDNFCGEQSLIFKKKKNNKLEINGYCLFSIRKIIDFLINNYQSIKNK